MTHLRTPLCYTIPYPTTFIFTIQSSKPHSRPNSKLLSKPPNKHRGEKDQNRHSRPNRHYPIEHPFWHPHLRRLIPVLRLLIWILQHFLLLPFNPDPGMKQMQMHMQLLILTLSWIWNLGWLVVVCGGSGEIGNATSFIEMPLPPDCVYCPVVWGSFGLGYWVRWHELFLPTYS